MGTPASIGAYHAARFCPVKMPKVGANIRDTSAVPAGAPSDSNWALHCSQKKAKPRKKKATML